MRLFNFFSIAFLMAGALIVSACTDTDTVEVAVPGPTTYVCSDEDKTEVEDPAMCPAPPEQPDCHQLDLRSRMYEGSSGADKVCGSSHPDRINGLGGDDTLLGQGGKDTINGGDGNDTLEGGAGDDTINGGDGNDELSGDAGVDTLMGNEGNDTLYGGDGGDTLDGNEGDDQVYGDAGNDTLVDDDLAAKNSATDVTGIDVLDGGDDTDTVDFSGITDAKLMTYNDSTNSTTAYLHISLMEELSEIRQSGKKLGEIGDVILDVISNVENVKGSGDGPNQIIGDNGNNVLTGGSAGDVIKGMGGDDTIDGMGGDSGEILDGGAGNDTLIVRDDYDLNDQRTLTAETSNGISGFENLTVALEGAVTGTTDNPIELTGDDNANMLIGGTTIDKLNGGKGNDKLNGGKGNDELNGGPGADEFIVVKGEGDDEIAKAGDDSFSHDDGDRLVLKGFTAADQAVFDLDRDGDKSRYFVKIGNDTVATVNGTIVDASVIFRDK